MNKHEATILDQAMDQAFERDPDRELRMFQKLAAIGGPYFTWWTIQICIRHKIEFPDWVIDYLGKCADRIRSDKAERAASIDVRKTLLWIFGFPKKKKAGPTRLFGPVGPGVQALKDHFAVDFAVRVHNGEGPVEARGNAGEAYLPGADDRTLQRYLLEVFKLKKMPSTFDEWMSVFDRHLMAIATRYYDREDN